MKYIFALGLSLFFLSGCVSKVVEDNHPPAVMIAQNSDGVVSIAWDSKLGYDYTLYYQEASGGDWRILGRYKNLSGTGKTMNAQDRVNPRKKSRRYRVLPTKHS